MLCRRLTLNNPILEDALNESRNFFTKPDFVPRGLERLSSGDRSEVAVVMGGEERNDDPLGAVPTNMLMS